MDKLANKTQCHILRKMIDTEFMMNDHVYINHNNRVLSSYMEDDTMIVETEDGRTCSVNPDGEIS